MDSVTQKAQTTKADDQAFATPAVIYVYGDTYSESRSGLSKREFFAALALQGLLANPNSWHNSRNDIASEAVLTAEALIKALNFFEVANAVLDAHGEAGL